MKGRIGGLHFVINRAGQAMLSLVLLIGAIIIFGGVSLALLVINFLNSSYGYQSAQVALATASSGINDALLQLDRNNAFSSAGYCVPYAASCGATSTTVTVTQNSPSLGQITIVSDAKALFVEKKIQAVVSVNSQTGDVRVVSWAQLTL